MLFVCFLYIKNVCFTHLPKILLLVGTSQQSRLTCATFNSSWQWTPPNWSRLYLALLHLVLAVTNSSREISSLGREERIHIQYLRLLLVGMVLATPALVTYLCCSFIFLLIGSRSGCKPRVS